MTVIVDNDGNEFLGSRDAVGALSVTETRSTNAVLSSLNAEIVTDLHGKNTMMYDVRSAVANMTIVVEGTIDGTNYFGLPSWNILTEAFASLYATATTYNLQLMVNCAGLRRIKVRVSVFASGTVTIFPRASSSLFSSYNRPQPATINVTATAVVNTGSTATLPAIAGLFHYITHIELIKLYAVVGIANGAGVLVTTTNLIGSPIFTTEQLASPAGTAPKVIDQHWTYPMKSSVVNVATTFVAPAQLQTIWRWNISYYLGA